MKNQLITLILFIFPLFINAQNGKYWETSLGWFSNHNGDEIYSLPDSTYMILGEYLEDTTNMVKGYSVLTNRTGINQEINIIKMDSCGSLLSRVNKKLIKSCQL